MYSLVGVDGNAFSIMGYTRKAMQETGFSEGEIKIMLDDARSSDYNHLIYVCGNYIDKCNERL